MVFYYYYYSRMCMQLPCLDAICLRYFSPYFGRFDYLHICIWSVCTICMCDLCRFGICVILHRQMAIHWRYNDLSRFLEMNKKKKNKIKHEGKEENANFSIAVNTYWRSFSLCHTPRALFKSRINLSLSLPLSFSFSFAIELSHIDGCELCAPVLI